ncbi:MAG: CotH kinase family protein [Clostridia bacterium]|nr:CotH kinase family protein [Clostridia bacterium]
MELRQVFCLLLVLFCLVSCGASAPQEGVSAPDLPELEDLPDEEEEGVFYAASFYELTNILNSSEFFKSEARPTVCITESFVIPENFVLEVSRPVRVLYAPAECAWEGALRIVTEDEGEISVASASLDFLSAGVFTVDAPNAALVLEEGTRIGSAELSMYYNVATVNGAKPEGLLGGSLSARACRVQVTLKNGKSVEDATLYAYANVCQINLPMHLSESSLEGACVALYAEDGAVLYQGALDPGATNTLTLRNGEQTRTCLVFSDRLNYRLSVVEIDTEGGAPIVEKNTYLRATLTVDGVSYETEVRGRGNASWNMFPKKAYRLKLAQGAELFGMEKNRDWVLASNYTDKSLIRNCVAHTMAQSLSGLEYTPTHVPVHLYVNGEYMGVYTFADKIEDGTGRLSLGETTLSSTGKADIGFLLEIGWDFDEENVYNRDYFDTSMVLRIFVKEPKITRANTPEFLYVKNYILKMEEAVVANDGWEEYIDLDSWVDWFIINEFTFNTESSFYRSCYLYKNQGGKLKLGPVWDFDMAFGNHLGDLAGYDGFCTTESTYQYITENWMDYLIEYPAFQSRLKARWNEVKDDLYETALFAVDHYAALLEGSQEENFKKWDILSKRVGVASVDPEKYPTYESQIVYLRDFIDQRYHYLDKRLSAL